MKTKKRAKKYKWSNRYYIRIYQLAAQGYNNGQIVKLLEIPATLFNKWKKEKPTIEWALKEGREGYLGKRSDAEAMEEWIYQQLPEDLKKVWDRVQRVYKLPDALGRLEEMFRDKGENVKKYLFAYSMTLGNNFDANKACKKLGISKSTLDRWVRDDPKFVELMENIQYYMKNFMESALLKKVKQGSLAAILFVNKTKNKDRGYGEKMEVEHTGNINHNHQHRISIDELPLDNETRRGILRAMTAAGVDDTGAIDATKVKLLSSTPVKEKK